MIATQTAALPKPTIFIHSTATYPHFFLCSVFILKCWFYFDFDLNLAKAIISLSFSTNDRENAGKNYYMICIFPWLFDYNLKYKFHYIIISKYICEIDYTTC